MHVVWACTYLNDYVLSTSRALSYIYIHVYDWCPSYSTKLRELLACEFPCYFRVICISSMNMDLHMTLWWYIVISTVNSTLNYERGVTQICARPSNTYSHTSMGERMSLLRFSLRFVSSCSSSKTMVSYYKAATMKCRPARNTMLIESTQLLIQVLKEAGDDVQAVKKLVKVVVV